MVVDGEGDNNYMLGLGDCGISDTTGAYECTNVTGSGGYGTPGNATSSTNIFDAIMAGINSSSKILTTRYGVPQLNPGQYIQTGPGGQSIQYQLAPGQTTGFPGTSSLFSGGSSSGMLMLLGGGLILVLAMSGKH